jgi:hypothetical protein
MLNDKKNSIFVRCKIYTTTLFNSIINQNLKRMKRLITILTLALMVTFVYAQRPQGVIVRTTVPPVIDGEMDEIWDDANVYNIDKNFQSELPSLGAVGETTWRALWDMDGMYILLVVNDDHWYPGYMVDGSNNWEYDKPELYFDVNYILEDGVGGGFGQGHYQVAPAAAAATIDGTAITQGNGVVYAFKVNDPDYVVEYFIPWTLLLDKNGVAFDKMETMGFDVTIIDRDPGDAARKRAVWANVGEKDESWSNMDDAGWITFEGAEAGIYVDEITLNSGEITKNKGTFQMVATVLPEDATNKLLKWSIVNKPGQTGTARIDNNGRVRAIADGEVTVMAEATDGSYEIAEAVLTLSNQKPTRWDFSLIRNGLFDQGLQHWGGWIDDGGGGHGDPHAVVDGVAVLNATQVGMDGDNIVNWRYQFNQSGFKAVPDVPYILSFVAWGDPRDITVDFEDTAANNYNRYGASTDPESNGRSEWTFGITADPTRYNFNVVFDQIVPTTVEKLQFMISQAVGTVYLDSIIVVTQAELDASFPDDTYAFFNVNYSVVEVDGAANGTLTAVAGSDDVTSGDEVQYLHDVTFTAAPAEGFKVKAWTKDGVAVANHTANTYTTMVDEDVLVTVEFEVATGIPADVFSDLKVYPNPFNSSITISNAENVKRVTMVNLVGQRILDLELSGENYISTDHLNSGVYFMVFEGTNGQRVVHKMIKR